MVWFMVFILIFIFGIVKIKYVLVFFYYYIFLGMEFCNDDFYFFLVFCMLISVFFDFVGFG